jgi:acyl carrier protein
MDKQQIFEEIQKTMVTLFDLPKESITLESKLYEDLELDSIDAVDLVVQLQKWMNKKINPESFKSVRTVDDVVNAIAQLMQSE